MKIFKDIDYFYFLGFLFYGISIYILYILDELRAFPTFSIACVAIAFSYHAYKYSKEKFRLELMDKRWEIYEAVLKFCSTALTYASLSKHDNEDEETTENKIAGIQAAHEAFRGTGYHKYKMLFGKDIDDIFDKLNKSFAALVVKGPSPHSKDYADWVDRHNKEIKYISETLKNLPDHFKPYLYFGDYKK